MRDIIVVETHTLFDAIQEEVERQGQTADLNHFDTSRVTGLAGVFGKMGNFKDFKGRIDRWDVSNVGDTSWMFLGGAFQGSLSAWNVCGVENLRNMFFESSYDGDLSSWHLDSLCDPSRVSGMLNNHRAILPPRFGGGFSVCDIKTYYMMLNEAYEVDYHYDETQDNPWIRKLYNKAKLDYNHAIAALVYRYPWERIHPLFTREHLNTLERLYEICPHVNAVANQWEQMVQLPVLRVVDGFSFSS